MNDSFFKACKLNYSYGNKQVLFDVGIESGESEFISIIGPNGSGKSTLFKLLCGQRKLYRGNIDINKKNIRDFSIEERARLFAVINQKEEIGFAFTCLEMVMLGLHPFRSRFGQPTKEQFYNIYNVMEETGIIHLRDKIVTQISGGELQRVILARAIVQKPKILFMDEAMSELDVGVKIEMIKYLKKRCSQTGMSVIAINHDLSISWRYSDKVLALQNGEVKGFGSPKQVMNQGFFRDVFSVEAEILEDKGFLIYDNI